MYNLIVRFEMWLSLVERCVRDAEAAGSSPVISTIKKHTQSGVLFLCLKGGLEIFDRLYTCMI